MKAGAEYEQFIYEKFKAFYIEMEVKVNDKIVGKQSGIKREIDVSVKGSFQGVPLLYVIQCKDHNKPADVKILGEFSAVIKDIGASKGFLICSAGFTKTIHQYARTLGIELLTVEDINSPKWKADVEIPFLYKKSQITQAVLSGAIIPNDELIAKNQEDLVVNGEDFMNISFENGKPVMILSNYINQCFPKVKDDIFNGKPLVLDHEDLKIRIAEIWTQANFTIKFGIVTKCYLKFVKPDEFTQFINHLTGQLLPTNFVLKDANFHLDENYVEVDSGDIPVFTNLNFVIAEQPSSIGDLVMSSMNLG